MDNNKTKKKKILVIVPRMPYPLNSGGRIAIYETIKSLSKRYLLDLIIIDDNPDNEIYVSSLKEFSEDIVFFAKNKWRFRINCLFGLFKGLPLQAGYFYFNEVQKVINRKIEGNDLLFSFMIRTTNYGLNIPVKKVYYAIDSMFLNYKKSQEKTTSLFWKIIYKIEIPLLYRTELRLVKKYNLSTYVNREEAEFWKTFGNAKTLPHGIEEKILLCDDFSTKYSNVVAFIGRMDYQPNIEAVIWFCKNVVPKLTNGVEFWIIGGFVVDEVSQLSEKYQQVKILGFVDDPNLILRSSVCTVAPMQSGGGLQTKILMAMALESIVVTTSLPVGAIEGAENAVNMFIEDAPDKMAEVINQIYEAPEKFEHVKKAAKKLIAETYSLKVIENKLFNLVENLIE